MRRVGASENTHLRAAKTRGGKHALSSTADCRKTMFFDKKRRIDRVAEAMRKECSAGSEFPQSTEIQSFADLGHARATQNPQKLFADGEKDEGFFDKLPGKKQNAD